MAFRMMLTISGYGHYWGATALARVNNTCIVHIGTNYGNVLFEWNLCSCLRYTLRIYKGSKGPMELIPALN